MIFLNKLKLLKSISLKKNPKLVNMKLKHNDKILMYAHFSQNSYDGFCNQGQTKYWNVEIYMYDLLEVS